MSSTSDILIVEDRVDIIATDSGNTDLTTSRLNGRTPKLVIFLVRFQPLGDLSGCAGIGAADGTNEFCVCIAAEDDANASDTKMNRSTAACIEVIDPQSSGQGSIEYQANFVSFIPNGVRVNVTTSPNNANAFAAMFFAGDDLEVEIGSFTADAAVSSTNTLNFGGGITQWDLLIGARTGDQADDISNDHAYSLGFLSRQGGNSTGQCIHTSSDDGAGVSVVTYGVFDTEFLRLIDPIGTDAWSISRTGSSDTSITFTKDEDDYTASDVFDYIAIGMAGNRAIADLIDTPTDDTVDWNVTGLGFKPQAAWTHPSGITSANRNSTVSTNGNGHSLSTAFWNSAGPGGSLTGDGVKFREEDDVTTTDVDQGINVGNLGQAFSDSDALLMSLNDSSVDTRFKTDGWTVVAADVPTANSTARSFLYAAFGEPDEHLLFRDQALQFVNTPQMRM